jgi:hypothetical protein
VIALFFGLERTFKSLVKRAIAVAVASVRPLCGLERLVVADPVPVCYPTEEDAAGPVLEHADAFSQRRTSPPGAWQT